VGSDTFFSSEARVRLPTGKVKQKRACLKDRLTKNKKIKTMTMMKKDKKDPKTVKRRKTDRKNLIKNSLQKSQAQRQMKVKSGLLTMHR
jgi:hypothetical protein